jgi:PKD repeat protein
VTARARHLALGLVLGLSLPLAVAVCARAAQPPAARAVDARVGSTFVMRGRVLTAVRVRGEHRGQLVTRRWSFAGRSCRGSVCRRLALHRQRSADRYDNLVLSRVGIGRYSGRGRFYAGLRCEGQTYPRGELVPYRITVRVTRAVAIQGLEFARRLTATYTNLSRIDRTRCPIGPSHDAARYSGSASPLPSPPTASFSFVVSAATDSASFTDTSARGAGGAPIVARLWKFGDPASGSANLAGTTNPQHDFTAPGTYQVSLIVTDANGLSSAETQPVIAAGPPTAAFTSTRIDQSVTYAFQDGSAAGIGGAAIVSWLWNFGDDASGGADESGAQNPQHTFTAPGTYDVCLIVVDANGRHAGGCADLTVPAAGAPAALRQSPKRSVASTAASSPTSRAGR